MLLVLICLSGCGNKKQEEKKEEKQEQQVIIRNSVPRNLQGSYHERYAGRASLELGSNTIIIDWSSSASQKAHFEIPVNYDEDNQRLVYENAVLTEYEFRSDTESKDTEVYNDGSGHFDILNGILIWYDDKAETDDPTVFVSNDGANSIANPWFYTTDLSEAIIYSGIDFCPPIDAALPEGFKLVSYGANINGVILAQYESEDRGLVIRKSDRVEGQELSGDYNSYSESWQQNVKGLNVDCFGDGETANLALFSVDYLHYSMSCIDKTYKTFEGNGLTADQINSLINSIQ